MHNRDSRKRRKRKGDTRNDPIRTADRKPNEKGNTRNDQIRTADRKPNEKGILEMTQSGQQTENQMKKYESNIRDLWGNKKQANLHIIGIPEGEEK